MILTIHTFAAVKEHFGAEFELEGNEISSVEELREELSKKKPGAAKLLASCRFAVNEVFVNETTKLHDHATIYIVPPSSGG